jgi:type I site-specific restriction endonuclease
LIDPVLRDKGYNDHQWLKLETPAPVEATGAKGRRRRGSGRTDSLLCVQVGKTPKSLPVAVLEAKKESKDPLKGLQQTKANAIDAAVFDLKAVNPNAVVYVDTRTPEEIIKSIETQGKIVSKALAKLKKLMAEPN